MIKPPSSSEQSSETEDETTDETDAQEEEGTISSSDSSSGMDWSAANTENSKTSNQEISRSVWMPGIRDPGWI